jgi:hypothetical protein
LKSLSPKKERDEDVFFSPYDSKGPYELTSEINDLRDEPTETNDTVDERSRSVSIGGHTVIQDDWSTNNVPLHTFVFGSDGSDQDAKVPSVVLQEGRRTISSLESDTTNDLEAAIRPKRVIRSSIDMKHERKISAPRSPKRVIRSSIDAKRMRQLSAASSSKRIIRSSIGANRERQISAPLTQRRMGGFVDTNRERPSTAGTASSGEKRKSEVELDVEAREEALPSLRRVRIISAADGRINSGRQLHSSEGAKRRRLSKRARTRLTMREVNSNIQPGRHSKLESIPHFEKRKSITIPKIIDFFFSIDGKLIAVNVVVSTVITLLVVLAFPANWQDQLKEATMAVAILGSFLSFALVFRTQTCYSRWWEARTQ